MTKQHFYILHKYISEKIIHWILEKVCIFDSSTAKLDTPLMDFRYWSRFRIRVIGRLIHKCQDCAVTFWEKDVVFVFLSVWYPGRGGKVDCNEIASDPDFCFLLSDLDQRRSSSMSPADNNLWFLIAYSEDLLGSVRNNYFYEYQLHKYPSDQLYQCLISPQCAYDKSSLAWKPKVHPKCF